MSLDQTKSPDVDVGGLYGINVETLAGNKTLTPSTDEIYQYLDPGGSFRTITLDTASATTGDRFIIRCTGDFGGYSCFVYKTRRNYS